MTLLLCCKNVYARNLIEWPYGGTSDVLRNRIHMDRAPLNFKRDMTYSFSTFSEKADFIYSIFFRNIQFQKTIFKQDVYFINSMFGGKTIYNNSTFCKKAYFNNAIFKEDTKFNGSVFLGNVDFSGATFSGSTDFSNIQFGSVNFENTVFLKEVNFAGVFFENGVDLRRSDLIKTKIFIDHHTNFPCEKLLVYWSQLKGHLAVNDNSCPSFIEREKIKNTIKKLNLIQHYFPERLVVKNDSITTKLIKNKSCFDSLSIKLNRERYELTEIFYNRLRDNYLAQNEKLSADEVMYELASKRQEYLGEFWWRLYGWCFGWGYKPMRFALMVFLGPILLFAVLWYRKYYHRVLLIVDHSLSEEKKSMLRNSTERSGAFKDTILFARWLHVLYFSAFVLLSIRFEKEWIEKNDRAFLYWVFSEWCVGLILYVVFFTFVKSHDFGYVKGLLGF